MGKCKDCKHWSVNEFDGTCGRIGDRASCHMPEVLGDLAEVQSTYDVTKSWLQTSPEFGCVLFEGN